LARVLYDSSIYIASLRAGHDAALRLRRFAAGASIWLSSVVLEELYVGADSRAQKLLERLERDFDRAKRILVPNLSDWSGCGKLLGLLAAKYDYE
jgi:predicted nucleic acid-binding protein